MKYKILCLILIVSLVLVSCGKKEEPAAKQEPLKGDQKMGVIKDYEKPEAIDAQMAKLAPVEITFDDSALNENQKKALPLLVKAAGYMDKIFRQQVYDKNDAILKELTEGKNPDYKTLKEYFLVNAGPFDRLNKSNPFINLSETKPAGANYYPADVTKEEVEAHLKANPGDEAAFSSNFTVIRRKEGKLVAIPYAEFYKDLLDPAAKLMKEAAGILDNPSLKKFLVSRADAFASNDYYQSDIDWMDLKDHKIEIVIGPYEVYEDGLFGYKAAFECFITIVDEAASKQQEVLGNYLNDMEKNLPIDDKYKNFTRGQESPFIVADEVFTGGDTKAGTQTIAFNLPNDERVREAKGCKKVMLRNICRAKFDKCYMPVAKEAISEADLALVAFDSYFNHIMLHEVAHGLGPGTIEIDGKKTTVNKELKELYSVIEEAKADITGLYTLNFMIEKGVYPKEMKKNLYSTYLGGIFRSVRFGLEKAHGGANAIQLNYLQEKGGFTFDEATGRFAVNNEKIADAVKQLTTEVLMIEALGDYAQAKEFIGKYKNISSQLQSVLDKVKQVPRDIRPIYAIEKTI